MSQLIPKRESQEQDNLIKDTNVGRDLTFAPVQIIKTQIIQTSTTEVTQRPLIKTSPYQGLNRFNLKDRDHFFGRDELIAKLFEVVNRSNLSLVLGASGSGKSSVIRAGLIPELKKSLASNKFYDFIFTPKEDPFESLYRCLLSEEKDYSFRESEAKIAQESRVDTLSKVINTLKKDDERWLIFVDQFEELFVTCHDIEKRNHFIESLVQVAKSGDPLVKLILAMRADFLEQLSSYPTLGSMLNQNNMHLITDMHPDELRQAIEQPAAKHGMVFEDGLVEQIIAEVEGQKGYLPLLQYTLDLLWQTECRTAGANGRLNIEDRTLNKKSYDALEGVRGALQKHVNEIYEHLNQDEQSATQQIFFKLVNVVDTESGSKTVSRRAKRREFVGESVENTLQTFIDDHLLVGSAEDLDSETLQVSDSERSKQSATVEIAHEILLSSWDRLKGWVEQEKEAIILKNGLAGEINRWRKVRVEDQSKAKQELLKGSRLEQIVEFRENDVFKNVGGLSAEENQFIDASAAETERLENEKEARRRRDIRTAWGIAGVLLLAVIISTGLGLRALDQKEKAELNMARSLAHQSLSLFDEGKELNAFMKAIKAGGIMQDRNGDLELDKDDQELIESLIVNIYEGNERNRLQGHNSWVYSVSISPDGKTLASGSRDNTIKLWDLETGEESRTLVGHNDSVHSVNISPDGRTLASGSADNTIKLWDVKTGEEIRTLPGHYGWITSVNFSPDGKTLASGSLDNTIRLWDVKTGENTVSLKGHDSYVWSVSFSPDSKTLASGSLDNTVKLWNVDTGELLRILPHESWVISVSFSPDSQTLASGSGDNTIKLWDVDTGENIGDLKGHDSWVISTSFSPDGNTLASGSVDNTIRLWDVKTGEEIRSLKGHDDSVMSVSFSSDGQTLASGSFDHTIRLWNLETDREIHTLQGHDGWVYSVSLAPDGHTLASGSRDNSIKLWDVGKGREIDTLERHDNWVYSVSFSPDGQTLASGSFDNTIKLWNPETGEEIYTLDGHERWVTSVSFNPKRNSLASGSIDHNVKLWDIETGKEIRTLPYNDFVFSVSFSTDGKILAAGGADNTIKLWNPETGEEIRTLQGHNSWVFSLSFSPDRQTLASGSFDNTIKLWNVETGEEIRTLPGHDSWVISVRFNPDDGKTLASGSVDKTIKLWNVETGEEIRTLPGHDSWVHSLSFSADGQTLASGSGDKTIKLWNLNDIRKDLDTLMTRSCDWVGNYLQHNPKVEDEYKSLCNGIDTQK